jgi:hypothetical protein
VSDTGDAPDAPAHDPISALERAVDIRLTSKGYARVKTTDLRTMRARRKQPDRTT